MLPQRSNSKMLVDVGRAGLCFAIVCATFSPSVKGFYSHDEVKHGCANKPCHDYCLAWFKHRLRPGSVPAALLQAATS